MSLAFILVGEAGLVVMIEAAMTLELYVLPGTAAGCCSLLLSKQSVAHMLYLHWKLSLKMSLGVAGGPSPLICSGYH